MNEPEIMEELYLQGLEAYHNGDYYDAHEFWEDLWSDHYFEDRRFVQGLIQLSVSFVHLQNNNLNGAKGLMRKCIEKFNDYNGIQREINVDSLKKQIISIQNMYDRMNSCDEFEWEMVPELI